MLQCADDKTIYIIDGYGFIFRAFYAVPNLTTDNGIPIGAVYGFFKMLISLINSAKPNYVVVALDTGKRTFRNDIYDKYIEDKAIEDLFLSEHKSCFDSLELTLEDLKMYTTDELIDKFKTDKQELSSTCKKYDINELHPPKILVILMFLGLTSFLKVEDYKSQYKANRRQTPKELKSQFAIIHELIDAIGIKTESKIGFEADDIIGSLSKEATKSGYKSIIVSADKDLCQLVKDNETYVYDPMKKVFLDENGVFKRFGVRSDQICDYLSIVGDHCDNILGVNGIGPKGAIKLLEKYGHIENIMLHINELDEKMRQKFLASKDVLELAIKLIELHCDAIEVNNFEQYKLNINYNGLKEFMEKYGFKSIDAKQRKNSNISHEKNGMCCCDDNPLKQQYDDNVENKKQKKDDDKKEKSLIYQKSLF